ncbi:protein DOWNY MILDEW RESISTANCE 6-like [Impatiens glandulifera]|uniref:protein DOWNY MILDEW RESISTANCE 6-like n=1 Tax=Impatiens glandulifera TaxID=253017 RepID=UPI001FB161C6|nr:protein DOWNY MILDEW RESISTANCE 6-like [Impatiens glandulifera]
MESVPESYIQPIEKRPNTIISPLCDSIPIIDLHSLPSNRSNLIDQIIKASQDYGFFHLINHGISSELMKDMPSLAEEFFALPPEDKTRFYSSDDPNQTCILKQSVDYAKEKVHFWRENFRHSCYPLQNYIEDWPTNPPRYKEVVGNYAVQVRETSILILDLICEGLGLENNGYLKEGFSQQQLITLNHYPKCPDPTLVLGLPKHCDPHVITLLNQGDVPGLEVYKDQEWFSVKPIPNAFVVNIGYTLEIISNGKLKSGVHRVVTNPDKARTTIVNFILPSTDSHIEPAKELVERSKSPPAFKGVILRDFFTTYAIDLHEGTDPLQRYIFGSP